MLRFDETFQGTIQYGRALTCAVGRHVAIAL